jgi:hypothetical protein
MNHNNNILFKQSKFGVKKEFSASNNLKSLWQNSVYIYIKNNIKNLIPVITPYTPKSNVYISNDLYVTGDIIYGKHNIVLEDTINNIITRLNNQEYRLNQQEIQLNEQEIQIIDLQNRVTQLESNI